jgi:hypothetical protein
LAICRTVSLVSLVLAPSVVAACAVAFVAFVVADSGVADSEEASAEASADRRVQAVISQIRIFTQIILALISRRPHLLGPVGSGWMVMAITQDLVREQAPALAPHMLNLSPASKSWSAMYVDHSYYPPVAHAIV